MQDQTQGNLQSDVKEHRDSRIVREVNSFPADSPCYCPRGCTPKRGTKEVRIQECSTTTRLPRCLPTFAVQVRIICTSGPVSSKVDTVLCAQKDVNKQRRTEQSWRQLADVTVRTWLSQPQSPVRRRVEALAALRNEVFDVSEGRVAVWKNMGNWEPKGGCY